MNFCAMLAHLLWTAVLYSTLLGLVTAQSVPAPAHISSSYVNRLLTEYGTDGGLSPAGLQRLMEQLGVSHHHSSSHGHHHGHSDHTDHEHSQRAAADHESGLEHRDGGGDRGTHAAHPDGDWTADHSHGTELLHETDHHHALSHDHQSEHHHQQAGAQGQDDEHDHDHGSHDHDHGSHDHNHGSHDHDHGSHDQDHGSHDHDHGSHDHDHGSHDHDHGSHEHDHGSHEHDHGSHEHDHGSQDQDHGSHDHDHGSHGHDHGSQDHDHGSHDHDHGSHDHDPGSHDHSHDHDHGSAHDSHDHDHGYGHANVSTTDQSALPERPLSRNTRDAKPQDLSSAEDAVAVSDLGRQCPDAGDLLAEFGFPPSERLTADRLSLLCPALVYHAAGDSCAAPAAGSDDGHDHESHQPPAASAIPAPKLWLFAGLSVLAISLCGLAGVAVVPIMQRVVYRHLLQFLVALAVGTLAGDALLHLLPHALVPHGPSAESGHDHGHSHDHSGHLDAVLKGLVALAALVFFFAAERGIGILHGTCTRSKHKKINKRLADMPGLSREETEMIERKIKNYRHSSGANHCFGDRGAMDVLARLNTSHEHDSCPAEDTDPEVDNHNRTPDCSESQPATTCGSQSAGHSQRNNQKPGESEPGTSVGQTAPALVTGRPSRSEDNCKRFEAEEHVAHSNDFTVIIHEHEHRHHGHTHTHGHIHQPAGSAAAVAGMVIVGDGLHNFTDGMAIGAAFAAGLASGLSTSVAVFCHELPHEIGDFAVLLQSGMSVRQALFYNVVSSVLCLLGMVLGMVLGNMTAFSSWVFAAAAGSFLYIALVDMVPELTAGSGDSGSSPCSQLAIQLTGMICGATIMLTIAIYENDLHSLITVL